MSYQEDLLDPRWQKYRLEIFERDQWTCRACLLKTETLSVHHVVYKKHFHLWEYPPDLCQTLCIPCHGIRQELADKAADALEIAIAKVPTERMTIVAQRIMDEAMKEL